MSETKSPYLAAVPTISDEAKDLFFRNRRPVGRDHQKIQRQIARACRAIKRERIKIFGSLDDE